MHKVMFPEMFLETGEKISGSGGLTKAEGHTKGRVRKEAEEIERAVFLCAAPPPTLVM